MRINFIIPSPVVSGGIKVVGIYADILSKLGHDVTVTAQPMPRELSIFRRLKRHIFLENYRRPVPSEYIFGKSFSVNQIGEPRPVTDDDVPDADIVVATWWETAFWVNSLSPRKGLKFYLLQGYEVFPHLPVSRVVDTFDLPLKKIAVSEFIARQLFDNHGVRDVSVVYNGVDTSHFNAPGRKKNKRTKIGFLYQRNPVKNTSLALAIARKALDDGMPFDFVAFSSGPPDSALPLPKNIEFFRNPEQSLIPEIYSSCDAWLFTSLSEGFGLPLLEAMACRTPVLATNAGAAPEIVTGKNGMILDCSVEVFVRAISMISEMPEDDWVNMSNEAHKTAQGWSWEKSAKKLESLFFSSLKDSNVDH